MASETRAARSRHPSDREVEMALPGREDEWSRRLAASDVMLDFLEGWVVADVCARLRTVIDAVYTETFEFQLVKVLLEDAGPQSLQVIATKCGVSRTLVLPDGRLRRALERMERAGLISRTGAEERPRYSLKRSDLTCHLLERLYEEPRQHGTLVSASLGQVLGHRGQ